ncbi:hypothetical protein ES332_D04G086800v1 [Gossypium tomentosum]|uniref:Uncharacterized protein n=1 Tax=Gossypium tomentosum TaxID=34277 RepID=A0A5D2LB76_GOSTO|nr:hypothetical protein ES332_D04G086800v1 [Gossypium tomentosum]
MTTEREASGHKVYGAVDVAGVMWRRAYGGLSRKAWLRRLDLLGFLAIDFCFLQSGWGFVL